MNWFSIRPLLNNAPSGGNVSTSGDCESFGLAISAWMDGELTPQEVAQVEAHVEVCTACQQDMTSLKGCCNLLEGADEIVMPPELQLSIRAALLSEQSVPNCNYIRSLLVSFVDGELSPADRERVALHVDECSTCDGQLVQIRRTAHLVASLPPVDPPVWLRARVLAQTTHRPRPVFAGVGAALLAAAGITLFFFPQPGHKTAHVALLPPSHHLGAVQSNLYPRTNFDGSQFKDPVSSQDSDVPLIVSTPKVKPAANADPNQSKNLPSKGALASIPAAPGGSALPAAAGMDIVPAPLARENFSPTTGGFSTTLPSVLLERIEPPAPAPEVLEAPAPVRRARTARKPFYRTTAARPSPIRNVQPHADNSSTADVSVPGQDGAAADSGSPPSSENTDHTVVFHRLVAHDRLGGDTDLLQVRYPETALTNRGERAYVKEGKAMELRSNGFGRTLNGRWAIKAATHRMIKW